ADQDKIRLRIARISLVIGSLLLIFKFYAYEITDSQAILSDALESIVNVLGAVIALITISIASKPADKDHPYGHGKAEYFSVAFEGGFISFAAALIFYEAVRNLVSKNQIQNIEIGIYFTVFAGLVNGALGFYLKRAGKKLKSLALKGSGDHLISDFITSIGLAVGLVVVIFTKAYWIDSVIAIILGFFLAKTGFGLVKKSLAGLMDAEDLGVIKKIGKVFAKKIFPGIIRIHYTRVIRSGRYHHIDAHIVVPEFWDVTRAHNEVSRFEKLVFEEYPNDGELHFHLDPCRKAYCEVCDLADCPIRQKPFVQRLSFTLEELTDPQEPEEFRKEK
ncbi:MAG: cation diffusion facilitator family transporter, partial [Bdellovibrionota bacterium]